MTLPLSQIFKGSTAQAFRGLTNVLTKTKEAATTTETDDANYLDARLFPDMNDMKWQVQMITEFAVRGAARMSGVATDELPDMPMEGETFDALIERVEQCADTVAKDADWSQTDDGTGRQNLCPKLLSAQSVLPRDDSLQSCPRAGCSGRQARLYGDVVRAFTDHPEIGTDITT